MSDGALSRLAAFRKLAGAGIVDADAVTALEAYVRQFDTARTVSDFGSDAGRVATVLRGQPVRWDEPWPYGCELSAPAYMARARENSC